MFSVVIIRDLHYLYLSIPSLSEGTRWVQVEVSRLRKETLPALSPYRMRSFLGKASDMTGLSTARLLTW